MLGLEQVHVERVLEVGRRVRRDHERGAVGAQHARELDHVQRRVHEVLDDVRRHDEVDAARRAAPSAAPSLATNRSPSRRACSVRGQPHRLRAVVGADHEPVRAGEALGLVADATADVDARRRDRGARCTSR